jgi:hypothetical protein
MQPDFGPFRVIPPQSQAEGNDRLDGFFRIRDSYAKPDAPPSFDNSMPHRVGLFQIREARMRAVVVSFVILASAGLPACNRGVDSKAAVQAAIEQHLKQQPNVAFQKMTVELGDITFSGDTAQVRVKFRSKEAPSFAVGVLYKLRREGSGWQVESALTANMPGASPHGNTPATAASPMTGPTDLGPQPSH